MKKLLTILTIAILLTGCGTKNKEEVKTCNIVIEDGINANLEMKIKGQEDKIKTIDVTLKMPVIKELLTMDEKEAEENMKRIEEIMKSEINKNSFPGVKADVDVTKKGTIFNTQVDFENANDKVKEYLHYDEELTMHDYINVLEKSGFTCQ